MQNQSAQSIAEFCREMDISVATFYRRLNKDMPRVVTIGKQKRILPSDKEKWIQSLPSTKSLNSEA